MERLCAKADVKKYGFHAIRHYVASIIADSGKATLRQIQTLLWHQRPTTTDLYLKGVKPDMRVITDILDESREQKIELVKPAEEQS